MDGRLDITKMSILPTSVPVTLNTEYSFMKKNSEVPFMDFLADSPVHEEEKIKFWILRRKVEDSILLISYSKKPIMVKKQHITSLRMGQTRMFRNRPASIGKPAFS